MQTRQRTRNGVVWVGALALPLLVLALVVAGGRGSSGVLAQEDATPVVVEDEGRPAHIHSGSCADEGDLGDVVQALNNLTAPTGTGAGQEALAVPVESSLTTVPLTLDAILAEDHAVNVHLSVDEVGTYIACGEVGGVISDADGSVTIGLREQEDSGFAGVAYLAPGADGASTLVSVFVAEGLFGDDLDDEGAEEETAEADDEDADAEATPDN